MDSKIINELIELVGEKNVYTNPADLYTFSFDAALDRAMPSVVVVPKTPDQVARVVNVFINNKIPYVARGAATSLCGGPVPLNNAAVISLARLRKIGKIDKNSRQVFVEPGVVNLKLQNELAPFDLFYPPDPGSQKACTIGGNIGTNAGGPHCLKYGVTSHYVLGINVIFPDGKRVRLNVDDPGFDLVGLFVGSEGTLGIVTQARLKVLPKPKFVRTMLVSFGSIEDAIQSVTEIIAGGILPATMEAMDKIIIQAVEAFSHAGYPQDAEAVLLIEVDGDELELLDQQSKRIQDICEINRSFEFRFAKTEEERTKLWEGRRGSYPAMARLAPNVLVEDGAVPRTKLPEALSEIKRIAAEYNIQVALLFHAGDGNLHPQILFDERDTHKTKIVKQAGYKMLKACVDLGGTISGEHGIGIDKREAMKWLFDRETLSLFRRIKSAFDKDNLCNPDKLIPLVGTAKNFQLEKDKKQIKFESVPAQTPANENELIDIVSSAHETKKGIGVQGFKTKYKIQESLLIHTTKLNEIIEFDKGNLTVTAQCGVPIETLRQEVEKANQFLWVAGEGSVGGVIASRSSVVPPLREIILGMRVLLPTGDVVKLGAKTMKNVAGYDVARLMIGSWGTLGIILDVTFRLFPYAAPKLESQTTRPFVFNEIHKTIKNAFDPLGIMGHRTSILTKNDIENFSQKNQEDKQTKEAQDIASKLGDRFWF